MSIGSTKIQKAIDHLPPYLNNYFIRLSLGVEIFLGIYAEK